MLAEVNESAREAKHVQAIDAADAEPALRDEARDVEPDLPVAPGALARAERPELLGVVLEAAPFENVLRPVGLTAVLELHGFPVPVSAGS